MIHILIKQLLLPPLLLSLSLSLSPLGYCQTSRRLIILVRFHLLPLGLTLIVALPSMGFRFFFFFGVRMGRTSIRDVQYSGTVLL